MGAEDYLTKPCNARELLARANAALRARRRQAGAGTMTTAPRDNSWVAFQGWRFDLTTRQLFDPGGGTISLSEGEYQLLRVFVANARQVLNRHQLLDQVYGASSDHYDRAIDVQLCRLRRKLSAGGLKGQTIRTVRNEGYIFVHPVTAGNAAN
jgi:DNA-binding response OmpR family regulator